MSKELLIYINLQTDNNFECQSTNLQWNFLLFGWSEKICKKDVLNNNESLIRKRKKGAWYHTEFVSSLLFQQILDAEMFSI